MRTVDPQPHKDLMQRFDNAVRSGIERILGKPLNGKQWTQASLPFMVHVNHVITQVTHLVITLLDVEVTENEYGDTTSFAMLYS